jgi:hypothetical protein
VLLGALARPLMFGQPRGLLAAGGLQARECRAQLAGALLGGGARCVGFLALVLELGDAVALAVQQQLRGAQLRCDRLKGALPVPLRVRTQLGHRGPGVGAGVRIVRGMQHRRIEHWQLGRVLQVLLGGGRWRRHRSRTHRVIRFPVWQRKSVAPQPRPPPPPPANLGGENRK